MSEGQRRIRAGSRGAPGSAARAEGADGAACAIGSETVLGVLQDEGDHEVLLVSREGRTLCRVRGSTAVERDRLREIGVLLEALAADGVRAAPRIEGSDASGLLLERAVPLRGGGGRRRASAAAATPPTQERRALVAAREDLDALAGALHSRGWVTGLAPGGGIGSREDGSVVLADLHALHRSEQMPARLADQHWVDSVLEDQGRTLRRRIDLPAPSPAPGAVAAGSPDRPSLSDDIIREVPLHSIPPDTGRRLGRSGTGDREAAEEAEGSILGPEATDRRHRRPRARTALHARAPLLRRSLRDLLPLLDHARRVRSQRPLRAAGSAPEAADSRSAPPRGGSGRGRGRGRRSAVRPRPLALVLAAGALVVAGSATALGVVSGHSEPPPAPGVEASARSEAPTPDGASAAPTGTGPDTPTDAGSGTGSGTLTGIDDSEMLAQQITTARHRYVIGEDDVGVAAEGSPAEAQDEKVRAAYDGASVRGSGPHVVGAEVEEIDEESGAVRLRVRVAQGELRIEMPDGSVAVRPALEESEVVLDLVRVGEDWRVREVSPV